MNDIDKQKREKYSGERIMKDVFVAVFILGFLGVAVFGFLAMGEGLHEGARCIAVALQGKACPEESSILPYAAFHVGALKIFSTAILFLLGAVSLFVVLFLWVSQKTSTLLFLSRQFLAAFAKVLQPAGKQIRWFALHVHSPTPF